ncbi:MAG: DNA alkylation repair protein [Clostridiales bacterium]|nr:DNA alkylation repair protein [Clostridiales bacterium]
MNPKQIEKELFGMQDKDYAVLQQKIIPAADPGSVIGVRTPELRSFAKVLYKDEGCEKFLKSVPHKYFDENQLHAFVISLEKDFDKCVQEVEEFLPYVDNWATCDQMSPKVFKKDPDRLLPYIKKWIKSEKTYTVRFAIGMLMEHFLGDNFLPEYADMVAEVSSDEYYINMMRAWYYATALAKQYDAIIPYVENKRLDDWTHNKTIQKSVESYRITDEQKQYLRSLKVGRRGK